VVIEIIVLANTENSLLLCIALLASGTTALLFKKIRLPLWPLTGGLVGAAAGQLSIGSYIVVPEALALTGQLIIGTAIGCTITPEVLRQFGRFLVPGLLIVTVVIGAGILFGWVFMVTGLLPPVESFLSLLPGGVGEMVAASVALEADSSIVVGAHMVRLLSVIWSLPIFLWAAEKLHQRKIGKQSEGPSTGE